MLRRAIQQLKYIQIEHSQLFQTGQIGRIVFGLGLSLGLGLCCKFTSSYICFSNTFTKTFLNAMWKE